MNVPATGQKRLAIVGATGMVGGYAFRYALDNPDVGRLTAINRRKLGISHPKLDEVVHRDFADSSPLAEALSRLDAAIFCLGTYTGSVSDAELRKITVDYRIEFARVLHGSSPEAAFSFFEREWRGDRPKPNAFCALQGRGPRMHYSWPASPAFTYFDPRISTPWSRARNRTSVTGCCAQPSPCFACSSPTRCNGGRRSSGNGQACKRGLREP
jgi:hypothetical protein